MVKAASDAPLRIKVDKYVSPTDLHVNLDKFEDLADYDIDDTCSLLLQGKVISINKTKDDSSMRIEVTKLKKMNGVKSENNSKNGDEEK